MKFLRYILAISALAILGSTNSEACGPYYPDDPNYIRMFRSCSPDLSRQWQEGCRFQDYEKEQNCLLWQKITSQSIPYNDIESVVYSTTLSNLKKLPNGPLADNKFGIWLSDSKHSEDLKYLLIAKEIEELRDYMNDPWYYAYDGDDEHKRMEELIAQCSSYSGKRHASRYALQLVRLYFASKDYKSCIKLWENKVSKLPQDIVSDMIASYVGGAYSREGNRNKAIELFTRSQDIGSLISLKAWNDEENRSNYTDKRVRELEYIFNRFPNSPLLSVKMQEYVHDKEDFVYEYDDWKSRDFHDPCSVKTHWIGDSLVADADTIFYDELKQFARNAISSNKCLQKGMWNYALGYLYYLDGNMNEAKYYLNKAENTKSTPFIKDSIRAFRFLVNSISANNSKTYIRTLTKDLKWLDKMMLRDTNLSYNIAWQYRNKLNWSVCYWQDVARKVLLGEVCPKLKETGNTTLALQLANYASNHIYQLSPYCKVYHYARGDNEDPESYTLVITFDEYRKSWNEFKSFDYSNQFFEKINGMKADEAAQYAGRITKPKTKLDRFLNERGYVDTDYIYDIVGTLYMREMNYEKAFYWLSKVSKDYQGRTNIAKEGYFKLDPFKYQSDKQQYISDPYDYKLSYALKMLQLEKTINSNAEANRKADAKIRYAIGLRNSFGKCWYLTEYGYNMELTSEQNREDCEWQTSNEREGFKDNPYAQKAYKRVDVLIKEALREYTNPERAAQAQLEMKNFATLIRKYPTSKAAAYVSTHCDNYHDYTLQKR